VFLAIWLICFFWWVAWLRAKGKGMVAKLGSLGGLLGGFLAAYVVLLLFCFSLSVVQVGVWMFVGLTSLTCFCVYLSDWFVYYNYCYHRKCLNDVSLDKGALSGRRSQSR
jgi:hypothetical protein